MIHKLIKGDIIQEFMILSNEIQYNMEQQLALLAAAHGFTWTVPLYDLARRLMNEIYEFKPAAEE